MLRVDRTDFTNFCSHTPRFDPKCESSGHGRNITNTVTAITNTVTAITNTVTAIIILIAIKTAVDVADVADVAVAVTVVVAVDVVAVDVAAVFVITFILTVVVAVADVYVVAKIGMQACVVFCSEEIIIL